MVTIGRIYETKLLVHILTHTLQPNKQVYLFACISNELCCAHVHTYLCGHKFLKLSVRNGYKIYYTSLNHIFASLNESFCTLDIIQQLNGWHVCVIRLKVCQCHYLKTFILINWILASWNWLIETGIRGTSVPFFVFHLLNGVENRHRKL